MILNHLNLTVTDVTAAKFCKPISDSKLETSVASRLQHCLTIRVNGADYARSTEVNYPKTFHIGFIQENEAKVNEIHQRLSDGGFTMSQRLKERTDGPSTLKLRAVLLSKYWPNDMVTWYVNDC